MEDELLTKQQVAEMLKVKQRTIGCLTATRQIPFIRGVGREYRYLKSSIMEWLKQKETRLKNDYIDP